MVNSDDSFQPAQLRGILNYVPLFRDHCFVVSLDSRVLLHASLTGLLTDLAVLRSLRIRLVLTYGIGEHLSRLAKRRRRDLSCADGQGPVDETTLELAQEASDEALRTLLEPLTANQLRWVVPNAVRAEPLGVRAGVDQQYAGRVARLDLALLQQLIEQECVPVLSPIQRRREGQALRLNSDDLAATMAAQLKASKLIYLTADPGLLVDGRARINLPVAELCDLLAREPQRLAEHQLAKVRCATEALGQGVERAHVLDGRVDGALLTEVFDTVGLGTMVHADAYQQIRMARPKDVAAIFAILSAGAKREALRKTTRRQVESQIREYFVYEADGAIIGCARLAELNPPQDVELAGVLVHPAYQRKGIGRILVNFSIEEAKRRNFRRLFALTTQAADFFTAQGFRLADAQSLPTKRREELESGGRASKVLYCLL